MQVRELIELLSKEPQTATVVAQDYEGEQWHVDGIIDFNMADDELILEIESGE